MEILVNFMEFIIWMLQCKFKRNLAKENDKDIVLFNSRVTPAICKLLDYKKYLMDRFKNEILEKEKNIQTKLEKKTQTKNISLQIKDKININDLKTKVKQLTKQLMKKNVGHVNLSIQTNKENVENAKGILMNFEKLIEEYLFPVGKTKEQFVGKDGEKFELKDKEEQDDLDDITNDEEYIKEGKIYLHQNFELRQEIFAETEENIKQIIDKKVKLKPEEIKDKETSKVVDELFMKYKKKDTKAKRNVKKTVLMNRDKITFEMEDVLKLQDFDERISDNKNNIESYEMENFIKTVEKYDVKKKYHLDLNAIFQNTKTEIEKKEENRDILGKDKYKGPKDHQKLMDLIDEDNTEFKNIEVKTIVKHFDKKHPLYNDMKLYFKKRKIPSTDENIRNFLYTTLKKNKDDINNFFLSN